ncbi:MAG TPA: hypothetical protein VLA97_11750 [Nocardioidaceae bacterium]|nr:hypothetical protein [Nocardioidaceae bacterium]
MMRAVAAVAFALMMTVVVTSRVDAGETPACLSTVPRPVTVVPELPAPPELDGLVETRIHWTRWSSQVVYGQAATLAGQVVTDDGAVSESQVELYSRHDDGEPWKHVGSASSDPDTGVFSFECLPAPETTSFKVVYEGTLVYSSSQAGRTVPVARRVKDATAPRAAGGYWFSGSVEPRYAGRPVHLQRKTCGGCAWKVVDRRDTTSESRWRFVLTAPGSTTATWYYRASVPGDDRFATGYSDHTWRITSG